LINILYARSWIRHVFLPSYTRVARSGSFVPLIFTTSDATATHSCIAPSAYYITLSRWSGLGLSVPPSVCLSVCLSVSCRYCIERAEMSPCYRQHIVAWGISFLDAKSSREIPVALPCRQTRAPECHARGRDRKRCVFDKKVNCRA